ncbi:unnamed protein product [Phytophthora lilii]|uniref:Unnamed protein product n=1 Tax=Phytophthora lilii TaxID=2077276 RepID=A0A9W6TUJ0_9STRA|nr:unnamed protein product [Phytophthora lilii]
MHLLTPAPRSADAPYNYAPGSTWASHSTTRQQVALRVAMSWKTWLHSRMTVHPPSSGKSKKQQIQELLEENAALKKEVEALKAEVAKKPNKFMGTLQQYGLPFLVWWTSLYLASGVTIYVALDTGLVSGASIIDFIMQMGLDKFIDPARLDPTYGNIAIAVIVNECIEVIRFPITLATLPYVKRVFSRKKEEEAK